MVSYDRTSAWIVELKDFFEKVAALPPKRKRSNQKTKESTKTNEGEEKKQGGQW